MKQSKLEDLFDYLPKSKIKAGDGLETGGYPFYTSSENQSKYLNDFQHDPGCLVFGTGGKASVHLTTNRFSTSTDCITIKPKPVAEIDVGYVFQYFKGNMQVLENGFKGAGLKHISKAYLSDIQIPYPERIDDQRRIAHLLGKVEGLIAQRKQHLQQLDDLLKSVFLKMFGDPMRNEKGWDKPDFGAIISSMRNGLSPSKTGVHKGRVYTLSAITGNRFQEIYKDDTFSQIHEKYYPMPSDFLLCRGNGNLGMVGKGYFFPGISEGVIFPDTIIAVSMRAEAVNKSFFEALWKTRFIRQQIERNARTTNGAHKINQGVIEKLRIIQPPIEFQNQFSVIVEKIEGIKTRYQQSLSDLEILYGALSQKAFKGELDLSRVPSVREVVADDTLPVKIEDEMGLALAQAFTSLNEFHEYPLSDLKAREGVLRRSFDGFLKSVQKGEPLSLDGFWQKLSWQAMDYAQEGDLPFTPKDYDLVKGWLFDAIKSGQIQQTRNDIKIDNKPALGNQVILKKAN